MGLKLVTLTTLLFLSLNQLQGQYIPLVEEGKFWIYNIQAISDFPSSESGHAITFLGDTTINFVTYKKVYRLDLKGQNSCPPPSLPCWDYDYPYQTETKTLISFIREDIPNKKIYNLPVLVGICSDEEHLIFDFSLAINDTINTCIYDFIGANQIGADSWGIVDSIKMVEKYEKERNTIYSFGVAYWHGLPIVDRVRISQGFGLEYYGLFHEPLTLLHDFCEGEIERCDLILLNSLVDRKRNINVFPNPSKGIFQISMAEEKLEKIKVYSSHGDLEREFQSSNKIDLTSLVEGVYFLEIITKTNERLVKKVFKENL